MEEVIGLFTVGFGLVLGLVYRHIMANIESRENSLLEEIENIAKLLQESEESMNNLLGSIPNLPDMPDALEQMEIMRAGILNNLMNLGVQFVGKNSVLIWAFIKSRILCLMCWLRASVH